jgi:hypothetical protein
MTPDRARGSASTAPADTSSVTGTLRLATAGLVAAVALGACGEEKAAGLEASYDGECLIELEFDRDATQADVDAFTRRVERVPHVRRIEVLPRADNIARFEKAIRAEGHRGRQYERFMARANRYAGRVLLVKADEDRNVVAIIDALRELPASITSMAERDSCPRRP